VKITSDRAPGPEQKTLPLPAGSRATLITFLLAEAEIERMPRELHEDLHVVARAKKRRRAPARLLLDQAVDHEAMRALAADADRRGRPDIAHIWSLLVMDSLVAKRGLARVLIHTRHDELIRVRGDARLPRSQPKFYQILEDLLRQGEVPLGAPLLTLERERPLERVVREEAKGTRVLMDVGGELGRAARFAELARGGDLTIVTGGFPRGDFRQAKREWFDHVVRVADEELTVWSAMVPALAGIEDALLRG
jgi:rRNA small subunit pseudouridine methyltransferase Nep1